MKNFAWIGVVLVSSLPLSTAGAGDRYQNPLRDVEVVNRALHGKVMDHTNNHGHDNRIWSRCLYARRDLYVYLPPDFDPRQHYPLVLWLHGFGQDEQSFLEEVVPVIDEAIYTGHLPAVIVAAADGSLKGEPHLCGRGSAFLNSPAGDFEDFLLQDVWDFMAYHYPIRSERQAHIIAGFAMGGFSAYNLAFKHRECFGVVIGISPPLNLRWTNRQGNYQAPFDPKDWGWRKRALPSGEVIRRHHDKVNSNLLLDPLLGQGTEALTEVARENPIEMIDRMHVQPGELAMYVAYGGKCGDNIPAQVESFLYLARWRGLTVKVGYEPQGKNTLASAENLFPGIVNWLAPQIAPYSPPRMVACKCVPCPSPCAKVPECPPAAKVTCLPQPAAKVTQTLPPSLPETSSSPAPKGDDYLLPKSQVASPADTKEEAPAKKPDQSSPPASSADTKADSAPTPKPDLLIPPGENYNPGAASEIKASPLLEPLLSGEK